jgi:DNA polymerase/3'-5' exonuclease PolX
MLLEKAQKKAERVIACLSKHSQRIEIVGSVRHEEENPDDIDIAIIPTDASSLQTEVLKQAFVRMKFQTPFAYIVRLHWVDVGHVDLQIVTSDEQFESLLEHRRFKKAESQIDTER